MSSPPRYHIPFPASFLSLNSRVNKTTGIAISSPDAEIAPHSFLSNRPAVPRHSSISSVSSSGPASGAPSTPPTKAAASPVLEPKVPAFLALNSKFTPPPTTAKEMSSGKSSFLSNRP